MSKNLKRPSDTFNNYISKRRKLKHTSVDIIRKYITSEKGEAIQALYMVFEPESFAFETLQRNDLPSKFVTFLNLEGYSFIGYGNSKVSSRSCASRIALLHLLDDLESVSSEYCDTVPKTDIPVTIESQLISDDLPDVIASLVLNKYDELRISCRQNLPWFKVISGIVMIRGNDFRNGKVLVVSTGSKCIEPKNIQTNGSAILDSHAEVLCRRAFQYFLYSQIELCRNRSDSILHHNGKKYEIQRGVSLYLFISSAPCGDCRIFTVSDRDNFIDKHPNRTCRGVLRIKLDGGNSTVPISKYEANSRFMIMSCSDKLLKMNVLGVQGSLLSNFIEPVYLTGVVIGDLFQQSHVHRALYERIGENKFPEPFQLNRMLIYGVSQNVELITKSPKLNMNWICENSIEITNSMHGKPVDGNMSRLCKYSLLKKFLFLWNMTAGESESKQTYEHFKNIASDYQNAKRIFFQALEKKHLGRWINKNCMFNQFSVLPV